MSRLAVIGDVHASWEHLERALEQVGRRGADGVILVGDLGSGDLTLQVLRTPERDARYLESVERVLDEVGGLGLPVAWVPGNHDLPDLPFPGNLDGTSATVAGLRIAGIGGAGPAQFGFCYEWDEAEIRSRDIPACDVLLVHCPPARTSLDKVVFRDAHAGSEAIRELALEHVGFLVCGHIHEAAGTTSLGRCLCLNAGSLGHPFPRPQVGWLERTGERDAVGLQLLDTGEERWLERRSG